MRLFPGGTDCTQLRASLASISCQRRRGCWQDEVFEPFPQHCLSDAASASPASPDFTCTNRIVARRTALQIASASAESCLNEPDQVARPVMSRATSFHATTHGASASKKAITWRRAHSAIVSPREELKRV